MTRWESVILEKIALNPEQFENWCIKALAGELTPRQRRQLDKWLDSSEDFRAQYDAVGALWNDTAPSAVVPALTAEQGWLQMETRLGLDSSTKLVKAERKSVTRWQRRWRPVLVTGLAVASLTLVWFIQKSMNPPMPWQSAVTKEGQRSQLTLSDGSMVTLNSSSRLRFPNRFKGEVREVYLQGEAFFEVKSESRPFVVLTDQAKTTVLGTKFIVCSREETTRVLVASGRVRVESDSPEENVILNPGEMSEVSAHADPSPPQSVDVDEALGWISGRIHFERTPLAEVLTELERHFGVEVRWAAGDVAGLTLTATFSDAPVETVLSSICLTFGLNFHTAGDTLVITR